MSTFLLRIGTELLFGKITLLAHAQKNGDSNKVRFVLFCFGTPELRYFEVFEDDFFYFPPIFSL